MVRISLVRQAVMRAVRVHQWGGPEVLKVEDGVPIPKPSDDQVLLKVHAAGINPVDTYIRSGTYARKPELPYTPGSDASGVVEAVGKNVSTFKKGDRAYSMRSISGACGQFALSEALHVGHLSDKLSFSQGACIGTPYYTAHRALVTKAKIKSGETVLIHGASGAVGLACVQIAKATGLKVIGTAGTAEGLELVKSCGASCALNHREEGYVDKIIAATDGQGPDVIIEMLSNVNLAKDMDMAKLHGRIVVIGCRGTIEVNPRTMMAKELQMLGVMLSIITPEEIHEAHAFMKAAGESGWLKPHVCREYKMEQVSEAHTDVINSAGATGKLVVKIE